MAKKNSFNIVDKSGSEHIIHQLSEAEFTKLKSDGQILVDSSFNSRTNLIIYQFGDRFIVQESDRYAIYPNKNILLEVLSAYSGPYKREILYGKNPYGKEFPKMVDSLVKDLLASLSIPLDSSTPEQLFMKCDKAISKNRNSAFFEANFLKFIALIGYFVNREFKSSWQMVLGEDKETWTPIIKVNSQDLFFLDYIIEDFNDKSIKEPLLNVYHSLKDIIKVNIGKS